MQAYLHLHPPQISSEQPPPPPERPPHPHTLACCNPRKPVFLFKVVKTKQVFPMTLFPISPILNHALCKKLQIAL